MLKKKNVVEDLDNEIPNDEQINEMLARNEDELQSFDKMDKERYEIEKDIYSNYKQPDTGDFKNLNYRLTTLEEVPENVKNPPKEEDDSKEYGKGNRVRKQVNYRDEYENPELLQLIEEYVP